MALLQRNVSGYDLLATCSYIQNQGPVTEETLLADYYPGDEEDPENSSQLKPIRDTLQFLVETGQVEANDDGYVIASEIPGGLRPRLALLWGIRRQEGEDAAYFNVLEHLASEDITKFNHGDELVDMMDGAYPSFPWNEDGLRYWRRVMNAIGVTQAIDADGEDVTTLLSPNAELLIGIAAYCMDGTSESLVKVLQEIDETFLPVYSSQRTISAYMQTALGYLESQRSVSLSRRSDRDVSVELDGTPYNSISLTQ